jgi:hypothetical protein
MITIEESFGVQKLVVPGFETYLGCPGFQHP